MTFWSSEIREWRLKIRQPSITNLQSPKTKSQLYTSSKVKKGF